MLKTKPKATSEQLQQAAYFDDMQAQKEEDKRESFARCDTDGFLSQWASGIYAELNRRKAEILRDGGHAEFPVLVDISTGEVIATKIFSFANKFGGKNLRWKIEGYNRKWIPVGEKSRVQKQMGFCEETRWFPADAETASNGTGLSGSVWIQDVMKKAS